MLWKHTQGQAFLKWSFVDCHDDAVSEIIIFMICMHKQFWLRDSLRSVTNQAMECRTAALGYESTPIGTYLWSWRCPYQKVGWARVSGNQGIATGKLNSCHLEVYLSRAVRGFCLSSRFRPHFDRNCWFADIALSNVFACLLVIGGGSHAQ